MKHIIKFRWLIAVLWVVIAGALLVFGPDLQKLVAEKGQMTVPDENTSQQANLLLDKMNENGSSSYDAVLVFHEDKGLSEADKESVKDAINILEKNQTNLSISDILDFTENKEIEEIAVAKDGTTIIVPFKVSTDTQTVNEAREAIYQAVETIEVDHELTGE